MIDTITYPVYVAIPVYPYCRVVNVNSYPFDINTVTGYRKQFVGIANNFNFAFPKDKVLDVSEYSPSFMGLQFNSKYLKVAASNGEYGSVGSAYWASMQSRDKAGHVVTVSYNKLLQLTPVRAKEKFNQLAHGLVSVPMYEGVEFPSPAFHPSLFSDYLHIRALVSDVRFVSLVRAGYTAFTDFMGDFVNSSARALATAVGLQMAGLFSKMLIYPDVFFKTFRVDTFSPMLEAQMSWENTPRLRHDAEHGDYWETGSRNIKGSYSLESIKQDFEQSYGWLPDMPLSRDWKDLDLILPDKTCMSRPYIDGFCVVLSPNRQSLVYLRVIFGVWGCIDISWDFIPREYWDNFKKCSTFPVCEELISGFSEPVYCTNDERLGNYVYPKITNSNFGYYQTFIRYVLKYSERYGQGASGANRSK